jgi:phosphatidylserine/phosphatidylglycerophosphate/cardiolipin synthase-like enzyme
MEEIITHLEESIQDEFFSKAERKSLRALIGEKPLDQHQLNFLRSRIYEMANERVTPENYRFIIEWIKAANSALITSDKQENSDVYFSPGEACRSVIINQLNQAVRDVKICVFTISDDQITDAIITTHKKGVPIQVITDNDKMEDEGSDIEQLADEGIPVKIDNTPNHMHHKFMVVDERALLTGSYNWTRSAARYNHENILLTKETPVIRSYLKEFSQLWKEMSAFK